MTMPTKQYDAGFATAEAAVAVPALMAVLALAIGVVVAVGAQLKCVDAARVGARAAARGDSDAVVTRAAQSVAPRGARIVIRHRGSRVEVDVTANALVTHLLPSVHVAAKAVGESEAR